MLEGFDIQSMGVAGPKLIPALHLDKGEAGWAFSASLIGLMAGAAAGGWLADRLGRKPVIIGSVIVFGLFTLATAMTGAYGPLLAARFITGLGLGGALPMIIALASERTAGAGQGATVSAITACMPLGGAVVALFAASALGSDWRNIFIAGGLAPLLLAAGLWLWLPETQPAAEEGAVSETWLSALFGPGRVGVTLCLWVGYAAIALVLHLFLNWLPQILKSRGFAGPQALSVSVLFNIGGAVGGMALGRIIQRFGARWPMGATAAALVLALLGLAASGVGLATTAVLAFAAGFLIMGMQFGLYGLGPAYYASPVRGRGVGAAVAAGRFGSALGPLAAGLLLGRGASGGQVVAATVPVVLIAGLAAVLLTFAGKPEHG
jgi:AAHS family 3-hydroxyphenylpropionic acid transporter